MCARQNGHGHCAMTSKSTSRCFDLHTVAVHFIRMQNEHVNRL